MTIPLPVSALRGPVLDIESGRDTRLGSGS
jgi:hypothetical protein